MPVKYKGASGYGSKGAAPALPGTPRAGRHRAVSAALPGKVVRVTELAWP